MPSLNKVIGKASLSRWQLRKNLNKVKERSFPVMVKRMLWSQGAADAKALRQK